jgi:hypothetical protein
VFVDAPHAEAARPLATEYSKSIDISLTFRALRQKYCQCQPIAGTEAGFPDRVELLAKLSVVDDGKRCMHAASLTAVTYCFLFPRSVADHRQSYQRRLVSI